MTDPAARFAEAQRQVLIEVERGDRPAADAIAIARSQMERAERAEASRQAAWDGWQESIDNQKRLLAERDAYKRAADDVCARAERAEADAESAKAGAARLREALYNAWLKWPGATASWRELSDYFSAYVQPFADRVRADREASPEARP